jgi:hypothetical protein
MSVSLARPGAVAALVLAGALGGGGAVAHADPAPPGPAQRATGSFDATVDFTSLVAQEVRGNKCELTVAGALTFTGTVEGTATGTTTAVVFAPCAEALSLPPGAFFDVFRFEGTFVGAVDGTPAEGELSYAGVTRVGGGIDATVLLDADAARAVLRADAQVAVGGTYSGVAQSG